jgi:signal transduction histidine kinase
MHSLLMRQIERHLPGVDLTRDPWPPFIAVVDETYRSLDLLQAFPDLVLEVDVSGTVVASRGTLVPSADAARWAQRRLNDVLSPVVSARFDEALRRAIFGQAVTGFEFTAEEPSGVRHYEIRLAPVGTSAAMAIVRDVSDRRRDDDRRVARDAADAASHARSAFLANMSHELRTPLNAIIGYSEMLTEEATDFGLDSFITDLGRISHAGRHLLQIVNTVLEVARLEAGQVEIQLEPVQVDLLTRDVVAGLRPLAAERENRLEIRTRPDLPPILTDPAKLRQILTHLIGNACKFTSRGTVTIEAATVNDTGVGAMLLIVRDTGIGIDRDQVERLFRDFVQLDASNTRRYGGAGLGLSISRRLSELLGGRIDVESVPGQGSTFTLRLPLTEPRAHAGVDPAGARRPSSPDLRPS